MKPQRLLIFIAAAIALAVVVAAAFTTYWQRKQPVFKNAPKLVSAMQAFSQDLARKGQPLPTTVSLRELVSRGYLRADDVRAFEGMEVTIWLRVDETEPEGVVMSATLPDGTVNAALADGSVQQFSPRKFAALLKNTGQDGTTNGSPLIRSGTNSPSSAAASRH
jgi:hypothetical protein